MMWARVLALAGCVLAGAHVVHARQSVDYASVSGRVTDPSGAVISGAQVSARHTDTNVTATTATDDQGRFRLMLWDRGTWHPETDDVRAALEKGDLKFTLDGYKLKGSWVLVRTRGWGGGQPPKRGEASRSWLLIKHRDEWSGDLDITTFAPLSVNSGGDFADILAQASPDVWVSNAPGRSNETALQAMTRLVEKVQKLQESEGTTTSARGKAETKTEEPTPAQQAEGRPEPSRRARGSASSRSKSKSKDDAKPTARRQRSRSS